MSFGTGILRDCTPEGRAQDSSPPRAGKTGSGQVRLKAVDPVLSCTVSRASPISAAMRIPNA